MQQIGKLRLGKLMLRRFLAHSQVSEFCQAGSALADMLKN